VAFYKPLKGPEGDSKKPSKASRRLETNFKETLKAWKRNFMELQTRFRNTITRPWKVV
jgi:predicted GIY-YIG superfamily endonuclease